MAIKLNISENQERVPLRVVGNEPSRTISPDDGNPYYVGARAYVTQTESGAVVTVIDKDGTTVATISNGADGADGNGITSIEKTDTSGVVDTYTIAFDDGSTTEFTVTNGEAGEDGADGADGLGIESITKTGTSGLVDTYTITYSDGTTSTFTVTNGQNGRDGRDGQDGTNGRDGADGQDGFSPTANVVKVGNTATITITDKNGTTTASISDGGGGGGGTITDVEVDGVSVVSGTVAEIDLTGKSDIGHTHTTSNITDFPSIPTKVSDLTNDAGYITSYTETDPVFLASAAAGITSSDISDWDNKSDFSGSYDDLTDKPTIPAKNTWYGYSSSDANTNPKIVTTTSGDFVLEAGNIVYVDFDNINNVTDTTISIDGTTAKPLQSSSFSGSYSAADKWRGGEVVGMVYNGTKFVLLEQGIANTSIYGITKLNSSTSSTSTTEAATPSAVKAAYDHGGVTSVNGNMGDVTVAEFSGSYNDLTDKPTIPAKNIWYGTCSSASDSALKEITTSSGDFVLAIGNMVRTHFTYGTDVSTPVTISVDGCTAKTVSNVGGILEEGLWGAADAVDFVYNGASWEIVLGHPATTSKYGITKLSNSLNSSDDGVAATSKAIKEVMDVVATKSTVTATVYVPSGGSNTKILDFSTGGATRSVYAPNGTYWATSGTTTSAEIETAHQAGKQVCVKSGTDIYTLTYRGSSTEHIFTLFRNNTLFRLICRNNAWTQDFVAYTPSIEIHDIFFATYNVADFEQVYANYEEGKRVVCIYTDGDVTFQLDMVGYDDDSERFSFSGIGGYREAFATLTEQGWTIAYNNYVPLESNGKISSSYLPIYNGGVS